MAGNVKPPLEDYYHYTPSKAAAVIFAVGYLLSTAFHETQYRAAKPSKFTVPLGLGSTFSAIGFVQRSLMAFRLVSAKSLFVPSTMFILGAGPTYAAGDYLTCGRLFAYFPSAAPMTPLRLVRTWIAFDLLAEVCVWIGAALVSGIAGKEKRQLNMGLNLVRVAMILQATLFASFVLVLAAFHAKSRRIKAKWDRTEKRRGYMTVVNTLYASSLLIIVRSLYHIADTFVPEGHYIRTHELPFLVCEAGVMLVNTGMFNIFNPGLILPRDSRTYVDTNGTEQESDSISGALADPRPLSMKILDPLDIKGLFSRSKGNEPANQWDRTELRLLPGHH